MLTTNHSRSIMTNNLPELINLGENPIASEAFRSDCQQRLERDGVLLLKRFLNEDTLRSIRCDGENKAEQAYFTTSNHNVYLSPTDENYPATHARNRSVTSSKGCITTDQIPADSLLHALYNNESFKSFLCTVLGESALYEYADPLSSINLHYASNGQELGWHFDNSSFAITLLIQKPEQGANFEYVKNARNAELGDMNYELVEKVLNGTEEVSTVDMDAGDLVLFRGRNSMHRVTPAFGKTTRMLVVLAYNTEPGISLSESARQTFYGRLG